MIPLKDDSDMNQNLLEELNKEKEKNEELQKRLEDLTTQFSDNLELVGKFLAMISHEIRTPVNSLQQAAKQLQADLGFFNNKDITKLTSIMVEDSDRLSRTIDLMVQVSQLQSGTYNPKPERFDIFHEVLAPIIAAKKSLVERKGVRFIINSTTLNCEVIADKYSSIQICSNLIDNSIVYTEKGIIEIDITRTPDARLQISIIDTGIGMDEEYLEEVFNLFSQESQGYTRKYEGIGLGLTAVKGFCEINKIDLSIKSEKYAGTVVTLVFA
ncbi:MAG: HAMP domain-containing histidine kinase [Ignavibacteriales bacterium]|nr:HAMP domain-containing histidine kinase [Ignavibacteriales bacterium]